MRKLLKVVVVLLVLVIGALVAAFFYINTIAKTAIEHGSTYALGVPTTLNSADIKVLRGEFGMNGLNVANPPGFATSHFLTLNDGGVAVSLGTLREEVITLPYFRLDGVDLNLEKKDGKSNYQVILDNLKKLEGESKDPAPKTDEEGKRFILTEVSITNVNVHVNQGGIIGKIDIPIDEIKLQNVGSETGKGVLLKDLAGVIVKALMAAAVQVGGNVIPAEMLGELKGGLAQLGSLDKIANIEELSAKLKDIGNVSEPLKNIGDKLKDDPAGALQDIGGLLGGSKNKK
jgi:uncharacterized protein involved in outer membrane biogenesis